MSLFIYRLCTCVENIQITPPHHLHPCALSLMCPFKTRRGLLDTMDDESSSSTKDCLTAVMKIVDISTSLNSKPVFFLEFGKLGFYLYHNQLLRQMFQPMVNILLHC